MCICLSKQLGCLLASFVDLFVYIPHLEEEEESKMGYAPYAWDMCIGLLGLLKPCIVNICHGICIGDFWYLCTGLCAPECMLI